MYFKRQIDLVIKPYISAKEILVVTGMRRVGKTALLRNIYDKLKTTNKVFFDFENTLDRNVFNELDYNNIIANFSAYDVSSLKKMYVFIDEIQMQPKTVSSIKYLYDHYNIKFFITGSSSYYLKNLFPESLAGRKIIFEMFPLTFSEFLVFKQLRKKEYENFAERDAEKNKIRYEKTKKHFDEYLYFGGFPQVVLTSSEALKKQQLNDIFRSYCEKDIQILGDFRNLNVFRDLMFLLMQRTGSTLDITKLSSETGVSRDTIYSYLAFLQGTYFIDLINPFTNNPDREISGRKKVYICDTGIVNHFAKVSEGNLFENSVYNNLKHHGKVNYYQRRSGGEIDFVLPEKNISFEVKLSGTERDLAKAKKISSSLKIPECYVVSKKFHQTKGFIPATEL
jgi:predicted AAA+ superfamily ATPase